MLMARERLQQEGTLEGKLKALAKAATEKGRAFFTLPEGGCCWRCPSPKAQKSCGRTVWRACLNLNCSGPHNIWHTPWRCMHLVLEQVSSLNCIGASLSASIALRHPSQRLPSIALGHPSQHPPRLHLRHALFSALPRRGPLHTMAHGSALARLAHSCIRLAAVLPCQQTIGQLLAATWARLPDK